MKKKYFSLIEIMIVLSIISLVAVIVVPKITGQSDEASIMVAQTQIKQLSGDVHNYRRKTGQYPSSFEDLVTDPGVKGWKPLLEVLPLDPWGTPYQFELSPDSFHGFEITSYGADKQAGGEGINEDLTLSVKK